MRALVVGAVLTLGVTPALPERSDVDMYAVLRPSVINPTPVARQSARSQGTHALSAERAAIKAMVIAEARYRGVPERLAVAVAHQESGFNPRAHSHQGAIGVMQVMPATARVLGHRGPSSELFRPEVNIPLGMKYLRQGLDEGGPAWAVARYHGGPNTRMHGPKTRHYQRVVLARAGMVGDTSGGWLQVGSVALPWARSDEGRSS